ncbi:MAG TPA: guanylate kinase [Burkholderiales bacterium]|nr:guanylate kinase [Burkholderiales bacterium]
MTTGSVFIVCAPSGAGKTSLVNALLEREPDIELSISYTTRPARAGESDGRHYHFVSRDAFQAMARRDEFLESAEVHGNMYGTSRAWIAERRSEGKDIVLEIDWQGAGQVRRLMPDAVGVFILPPSLDALRRRLVARGQDSPEVIEKRLAAAREEVGHVGEFHYVIINRNFDVAVADLVSVIRSQRLRLAAQLERHRDLINQLK